MNAEEWVKWNTWPFEEEQTPEEEARQRELQNAVCRMVYEGDLDADVEKPPHPYPSTHLLNPAFEYTPACKTDIRKTFERVRKGKEAK